MSPFAHRLYIGTFVAIVFLTAVWLIYIGTTYYGTPLEERFYHPDHDSLKPSGAIGHGLGIVGTLLILIGVFSYIYRKKGKFLPRVGKLKYWLEFHIFLCSLGPLLILFHTAFKFGGIVSISFWSMVAVVASGVIGRFIYIQIPRTIEGRELSLNEVRDMKTNIGQVLQNQFNISGGRSEAILAEAESPQVKDGFLLSNILRKHLQDRRAIQRFGQELKKDGITGKDRKEMVKLLRNEISLNNKIERLQTMQSLFKYWHVAHLPFALIMLIIMVIHVAITLAFGYRWIF